jgi:hypothetical protein
MSKIFTLLIVAAIGIIVVSVILYRVFYQYKINKQLNEKNLHNRKLLSPLTFSIIAVFTMLIAFTGLNIFLALTDYGAERVPEEYIEAIYDYQDFSPHQMTGYNRLYSISENPGYTKTVEQQGDIRFTCFISNEAFDYYHPLFIVYAEYTGDKDILYYGVQGNYYSPDDRQMTGRGHAGSEFEEYVCVIGTSTIRSRIELTIYLYDSGLKGENMGDYAAVSETINIQIP